MKAKNTATMLGALVLLLGCTDVSVDNGQQTSTAAKDSAQAAIVEKPDKPLGPDRHDYKSAYTSLQKAVAADDKAAASKLVSYPLVVSQGAVQKTVATPGQFVAEYDTIITPAVREVIVEHDFDTVVANRYDRSDDANMFMTGALLGAVAEGVARSWGRRHSTSNNHYYQGYADYYYDGCHGVGCLVDPPPPVSTYDDYAGCHGEGCLVDDPDATPDYPTKPDAFITDDPPEPGQTTFSDDSPPEPGQTTFSDDSPPEPGQTTFFDDGSDEPLEPGQTEFSDDSGDDSDGVESTSDDDSDADDTDDGNLDDASDDDSDADDVDDGSLDDTSDDDSDADDADDGSLDDTSDDDSDADDTDDSSFDDSSEDD
ncbi:hypothetical protein [Luteimonas salinilitoris]|uniref:Uncharacterized protein n=1 Tax=Luteimonas salinilitoris TaxID=3237697 RepID=A0ABV4HXM8_9GAMM